MGGTSYAVFTTGGGGGGGGSTTTPFQEVPAGLVNGSNVIFTLSHTPSASAAVDFYIDGLILTQGVDYTISGAVLTATSAPLPAQVPYAVYTY